MRKADAPTTKATLIGGLKSLRESERGETLAFAPPADVRQRRNFGKITSFNNFTNEFFVQIDY